METNEIDEIYNEVRNKKIEILLKYSDRNITTDEYQKMDDEEKIKLRNNIYENILSKITNIDKNNVSLYILLLKETGKSSDEFVEKYLTPENVMEFELTGNEITGLIKGIKDEKLRNKFLFKRQYIDDESFYLTNVIKATGEIDKYLTRNNIEEFNLYGYDIVELIKATGNIDKYLTQDKIFELRLSYRDKIELIKATGKIEEYLIRDKIEELELDGIDIIQLIEFTGKIEDYLTPEKVIELQLDDYYITDLINLIENEEIRNRFLFEGENIDTIYDITNVIKATGEIEKYLTEEMVNRFFLFGGNIVKLIIATGKIEDYLTKEKKNELKLSSLDIVELIKKSGKVEQYLTVEKIKELGINSTGVAELIIVSKKVDEYLSLEKIKEFGIDNEGIVKMIKSSESLEKYITKEKMKKFGLTGIHIVELIKATGKIEDYLTKEKIKEFGLIGSDLVELIVSTQNIKKYLTTEKIKEFGLDRGGVINLILYSGEIDEYLTIEKVKEFGLDCSEILYLLEYANEEVKNIYKFPWQENDNFKIGKINIHYSLNKNLYTKESLERIERLYEKNECVFETIIPEFLFFDEVINGLSEEQLIRITNYPRVQKFFLKYRDNKCFVESIKYLLKNDSNYVISIDKIMENIDEFALSYKLRPFNIDDFDLLDNLKTINIENIDKKEEFYQKLLCVLSDTENYFDIKNYDDIVNYYEIRNKFCLNILKGKNIEIPKKLRTYKKDELYRFALLEYKFGISLEEAKRIIKRYGTDSEKMQDSEISKYIRLLKEIIERDDIEEVIHYANQNNLLEEPWVGFPNARNAEGKILNMFEDLYNKTLYKTQENPNDKEEKEIYYNLKFDEDESFKIVECEVDVYKIKNDFNMNVRVEGAYSHFNEPADFKDYYNDPNIKTHGNCESYIRNDNIAIPRNIKGVVVGYDYIAPNSLAGAGPYDLYSGNTNFSIFNERNEGNRSNFRIPTEMIDNTRHSHNEMIKERLIIDKNGIVVKNKPSYAVWVEEDTEEERNEPGWKERRERNPQWKMTKKLAKQLGIPIVIIDREYFAKRETDKLEMLVKILKGEKISEYEKYKEIHGNLSESEYEKCRQEYENKSKSELINEIIIKYENNTNGLQFNNKLKTRYFTQEKLVKIADEIFSSIDMMDEDGAMECLKSYNSIISKEKNDTQNIIKKSFYEIQIIKVAEKINRLKTEHEYESIEMDKSFTEISKLENTEEKRENRQKENKSYVLKMFSELYRRKRTDNAQVQNVSRKLSGDLDGKENSANKNHDIKGE